ncbi:DNA recombination protein RmuC [Methylophilaceae bacterium]|jgi:DNA recombination protein RmuC|nr:DNA recombination protein RmuC [Methylophilaceae bacterium]|tara:strand:+ start:72 stop:1370 length:1299 start_codon:yes stop_codon:yes gene_type:complete
MLIEIILGLILLVSVIILWKVNQGSSEGNNLDKLLEEKHRAMIVDINDSLNKSSDRVNKTVTEELKSTRKSLNDLQLSQQEALSKIREEITDKIHKTLSEQGKAQQETLQNSLKNTALQLIASVETLTKSVDKRLEAITGKVQERLDEGFKKTNQTFISVMERLATIDEAQKKIDGLTTNMVSLQELLGDKRSRGAFGELQLEGLIKNILPPDSYSFQHTFSKGVRADCVLFLPDPTGTVAVDSKFPMENYQKMFDVKLTDIDKAKAQKQFKLDVKKHINDIASKYIITDETSDGAVMFLPAEAVFAEIHAYHPELIQEAMAKKVWLVSPTTLMAVLNTARAVLKDVETRKQVHIIKSELGKLGKEFDRFDTRMKKLADNIRQAHENAQDVHITSQKITQRFTQIEKVELEEDSNNVLDFDEKPIVGKENES